MINQQNLSGQHFSDAISFVFEQQNHKLIINAHAHNLLYCAKIDPNSFVGFDNLMNALQQNNFIKLEHSNQHIKLMVANIFELNFTSKDKFIVDELRQAIASLNLNLDTEIHKNQHLSLLITNQQIQIQNINQKLSNQNHLIQTLLSGNKFLTQELKQTKNSLQKHQKQTQNQFQELSHFLNSLKNNLNQENSQAISQIKQNLQVQHNKQQKTHQEICNLTAQLTQLASHYPKCLTDETEFMKVSRVVCTPQEKSTIRKFFTKTIKQIKLLYRASDHGFCIKKFHEKCDGIANTLTVVWTEFDKKIGGFTPLKWSSPKNYECVPDNSKESFIFSLTHNDKFILTEPEKAIYNHQNYGPRFGHGRDLGVRDKANANNKSYANICTSYDNDKYRNYEKGSWERFSGSKESYKFRVKEWEVWGVEWT